ncbi:peptide deformylase [Amnibacterium sp. CER49]|uniref:peptide deformylase n=1 Tax=Amnibacterium sp. CER49 TaxID=3039161 RepID=UPI00244CBF7A|nr:peptide deformylase [Amnibacterium sp. CER49]MDH2442388.1 peptide deformylase [Amnibacterium sp. CER49]
MTVLPIRITGDPVLHTPAKPVTEFDESLKALVADMFETMDKAPGVGLAAPQVGVPLRLFVYSYEHDPAGPQRGVAINPELWLAPTPIGEPDEDAESEGCLSVPGERFALRRSPAARMVAVDLDQQPVEVSASGWFARVLQHEYDHLDGTLYVDRLDFLHARRARKAIAANRWGKPGNAWLPGVDDLEA